MVAIFSHVGPSQVRAVATHPTSAPHCHVDAMPEMIPATTPAPAATTTRPRRVRWRGVRGTAAASEGKSSDTALLKPLGPPGKGGPSGAFSEGTTA